MSILQGIDTVIKRLRERDETLKEISFYITCDNEKITQLIKHDLFYNTKLETIVFMDKNISDPSGIQLMRYVECSTTLDMLSLSHNKLTKLTAIALANALYVNCSLRVIYLHNNYEYSTHIDIAFVNALRLNPRDALKANRHLGFKWCIYTRSNTHGWYQCEYSRLKELAEKSGPPSMLEFLLRSHANSNKITSKAH